MANTLIISQAFSQCTETHTYVAPRGSLHYNHVLWTMADILPTCCLIPWASDSPPSRSRDTALPSTAIDHHWIHYVGEVNFKPSNQFTYGFLLNVFLEVFFSSTSWRPPSAFKCLSWPFYESFETMPVWHIFLQQ